MKFLKFLFAIITILLFGCDKYSNYQKVIDNRSNDTITILFKGNTAYTNGTDSILVIPQNTKMYYNVEGSTVDNWVCDPNISINEVTVKVSHNKTLKKDISKKENWNCETNNTNRKMTFIITINDF